MYWEVQRRIPPTRTPCPSQNSLCCESPGCLGSLKALLKVKVSKLSLSHSTLDGWYAERAWGEDLIQITSCSMVIDLWSRSAQVRGCSVSVLMSFLGMHYLYQYSFLLHLIGVPCSSWYESIEKDPFCKGNALKSSAFLRLVFNVMAWKYLRESADDSLPIHIVFITWHQVCGFWRNSFCFKEAWKMSFRTLYSSLQSFHFSFKMELSVISRNRQDLLQWLSVLWLILRNSSVIKMLL